MNEQPRLQRRWDEAAAILLITVLAAIAVILVARGVSGVKAERATRAATADAVAPVADALRTAMNDAAAGTAAGAKVVPYDESTSAGVSSATATRARDSGIAVLQDAGDGSVVVATYDTPTPPPSVAQRREHVTGLRVVPLGLPRRSAACGHPRRDLARRAARQDRLAPRCAAVRRRVVRRAARPGPAPEWTLTLWTKQPPIPAQAWFIAVAILIAGALVAGWLVRRNDRTRRSQEELRRLQEASATTAALATVAQHSLDLADLLPALTTELATALGLQGLTLGAPTPEGERLFFAWGATPARVSPASTLPAEVAAGETICLILARGGRTVARLTVVAGRHLDRHDVNALGAATEVLTSALANAEAFAQQRDLLQRMRSVDELKTVFLATASHELRTPVSLITGYAQLLSDWDNLTPEEGRMYSEQVDTHAHRLGSLVEDLLDFSRLERGVGFEVTNEVLDLGEIVDQILDDPDMASEHQLLRETTGGLFVRGSFQAVERVVSNLVGNAAKYSPAGSAIRVSLAQTADRVELVVDDEGPGVPAAEREQVFSRFFRGQGDSVVATRGAGLGLAIVSEFAATMGGQVSVHTADSGGARFVVSYPLAAAPEPSIEGAADVRT